MEIRPAEERDLAAVNDLRKMVNKLHAEARPDIFRSDFCPELASLLIDAFQNKTADILVALENKEVVGFMMGNVVNHPETPYTNARVYYRIQEFGVAPACQRQGVGRAMINYLKDVLKTKGISKLELDVWEFNQEAIAFYDALGFEVNRRYLELDI